ncbi:MAG: rhodanese-like domain-containing protein [Thiobacillus sp.]
MGQITTLLDTAHSRSQTHSWSFAGALLPDEAHHLLEHAPGARLIDVRSRAELEMNGVIPGALHVEWQTWPGWVLNPHFMVQLTQATDPEALLIFICRSGVRSHRAAAACTEGGRSNCYNVLEGFEGDLNKVTGHRNELNGWKFRGLPWMQN